MSEPRALVEHFFRHEFGRLVAVLTRSLGVRRLDLVEDRAATSPMATYRSAATCARGSPGGTAHHQMGRPCPSQGLPSTDQTTSQRRAAPVGARGSLSALSALNEPLRGYTPGTIQRIPSRTIAPSTAHSSASPKSQNRMADGKSRVAATGYGGSSLRAGGFRVEPGFSARKNPRARRARHLGSMATPRKSMPRVWQIFRGVLRYEEELD
jgi:hypothetical protein